MEPSESRIISLLPSTTEILFAIGAGDQVVGVTHECDHPSTVRKLPKCTASLLAPNLTASEIDDAVTKSLKSDPHSIYRLDERVIHELNPTIITTQSLCAVCAVPQKKVEAVACSLGSRCEVIASDPHNLVQLFDSIRDIGKAVGKYQQAQLVIASLKARLDFVRTCTRSPEKSLGKTLPRVIVLEWPDPPYGPGHWICDQTVEAGGRPALGESGQPSTRVTWEALCDAKPDVIICAFCGYDLKENRRQVDLIAKESHWIRFTSGKAVYATDANAFFSRPGPRLIDGTELVTYILHRIEAFRPHRNCASLFTSNGWVDIAEL